MEWIALIGKSLAFLAFLYLPASFVLLASGARRLSCYAFSPLASLAILGVLSLLSPLVKWESSTIVIAFAIVLFCAIAARTFRCRGTNILESAKEQLLALTRNVKEVSHGLIWGSAGILLGCVSLLLVISSTTESPSTLVQVYDNPFHMSVIRHISETNVASPFGAGSVAGSPTSIYPDLWHALVALSIASFGGSVQENIWVTVLCFVAFIAPMGTCLLVRNLFPNASHGSKYLFASLGCILIPRSIFSFVSFGSLYPNLAGLALLSFAIALCIRVTSENPTLRLSSKRLVASVLASIIALGLLHPNIVIVFMMFLVPMLFAKSTSMRFRVIITLIAIGTWILMYISPFFSRTINCLDRVEFSTEIGMRLFDKLPIGYSVFQSLPLFPLIFTAVLLGVGVLLSFKLRKRWQNSWYLLSLLAVLAIYLCSLFPENWFSIIASGFWYRDSTRLMVFFLTLAWPLVAILPSMLAGFLTRRSTMEKPLSRNLVKTGKQRVRTIAGNAIATCIVLLLCVPMGVLSFGSYEKNLSRCTTSIDFSTDSYALTEEGAHFAEDIAAIVGGSVVMNNDQDQSAWLYPQYGINALVKAHPANYMASMPDNITVLAESLGEYASDSEASEAVRAAVEELQVEYVVQMTPYPVRTVAYVDGIAVYRDYDSIGLISDSTPGFELVYENNGMKLFRIVEV